MRLVEDDVPNKTVEADLQAGVYGGRQHLSFLTSKPYTFMLVS